MPGLNGLDFQDRLDDLGIETPIVFITAHGDVPMLLRAMKGGAMEFLTKPFREQDLLDAIQQRLSHDRQQQQGAGVHGELCRRYATLSDGEKDVMRKMGAQLPADLARYEERIQRTEGRAFDLKRNDTS